jgi:hypothetical protein
MPTGQPQLQAAAGQTVEGSATSHLISALVERVWLSEWDSHSSHSGHADGHQWLPELAAVCGQRGRDHLFQHSALGLQFKQLVPPLSRKQTAQFRAVAYSHLLGFAVSDTHRVSYSQLDEGRVLS